ncbi:MAG: M48 family metallopeptidase [Clostridia bacterium]|nr:M48 family metallopeptidase [Clostridia bacterium]
MYKILFLILLLTNFFYHLFLHLLSNKQVGKPLPASVQGIYNDEEYDKWRRYNNKKDKLGIVSSVIGLAINIVLFCTNIISVIYNALPGDVMVKSMLFFLVIGLVETIISLPIDYIFNFKIEAEFGFNKVTPKTFIADAIKNYIIGNILNIAIFGLVLLAYNLLGNYFGIIAFLGLALFMILISAFSTVFSKIFNKFTPLPEGELRSNLSKMFADAGYKLKDIYVMDASKRTTKANAYCGGIGKLKQIVLYDNLVNNYTDGEITAVFAHELAHFKNKDTTKMTFFNMLNFLPMMVMMTVMMIVPEIAQSFGFEGANIFFAFYVSFGSILSIVTSLIMIPFNCMSRRFERRADSLAYELGYGDDLISGLRKLHKDSLSDMNPHPTVVKLTYSHPPLHERIELIEAKKNNK